MVHLNVEMHNTRNSEDIVYSLWKHKVLRDIDKLYFVRREYTIEKISDDNKDIWDSLWESYKDSDNATLRRFEAIAENLFESNNALPKDDKNRKVNIDNKGFTSPIDKHQFWNDALAILQKELEDSNSDMSMLNIIPKSSKEAFTAFMETPKGRSFYKLEVPNFSKDYPLYKQPRYVINNLIFEFAQSRLEDKDTFEERYTPGGFYNMKAGKAIQMVLNYGTTEEFKQIYESENPTKTLREIAANNYSDFIPDYNASELSTIAHFQVKNAIYDKLIGISANQAINQRYTSLLNSLVLNKKISFGSIVSSTDSDAGVSVSKKIINGQDTELLVTEFLAAAVDAVKDALLEYYGMDDNNFNIACLMAKIGATPTDIGLLLNQPVVKLTIRKIQNAPYRMNFSTALDEAMDELGDNIGKEQYTGTKRSLDSSFNGESGDSVRKNYLTQDKLIKNITQFNRDTLKVSSFGNTVDFIESQIAVCSVLKELSAAATEFSSQVNASKGTSVATIKSNFGATEVYLDKCEFTGKTFGNPDAGSMFEMQIVKSSRESDDTIIDTDLELEKDGIEAVLLRGMQSAYCLEQTVFSCLKSFVREIIGNFFPYRSEGYMALKNSLKSLTSKKELSADIYDACNMEIQMFILERLHPKFRENTKAVVRYSNTKEPIELDVNNRQFYGIYFPEYFNNIVNAYPELKGFPIVKALMSRGSGYKQGAKNVKFSLVFNNIIALDSEFKDLYIESWEALFNSSDPIARELALHLFLYSYYNSGFYFAKTSVMSLAPLAIKQAIEDTSEDVSYIDIMNNLLFNFNENEDFITLPDGTALSCKEWCQAFIRNHPEFFQFTKNVSSNSELGRYIDSHITDTKDGSAIVLDFTNDSNESFMLLKQVAIKEDEKYKFYPAIKYKGSIYMCGVSKSDAVDENKKLDYTTSNTASMTYYKIENAATKYDYSKVVLGAIPNNSIQMQKLFELIRKNADTSDTPIVKLDDSDNGFNGQNLDASKDFDGKKSILSALDLAKEAFHNEEHWRHPIDNLKLYINQLNDINNETARNIENMVDKIFSDLKNYMNDLLGIKETYKKAILQQADFNMKSIMFLINSRFINNPEGKDNNSSSPQDTTSLTPTRFKNSCIDVFMFTKKFIDTYIFRLSQLGAYSLDEANKLSNIIRGLWIAIEKINAKIDTENNSETIKAECHNIWNVAMNTAKKEFQHLVLVLVPISSERSLSLNDVDEAVIVAIDNYETVSSDDILTQNDVC